jgi:hypothetical protein
MSQWASATGHNSYGAMSALPPKADIRERVLYVRFGPLGDISQISLLNRSKKRTTASDWRTLTAVTLLRATKNSMLGYERKMLNGACVISPTWRTWLHVTILS